MEEAGEKVDEKDTSRGQASILHTLYRKKKAKNVYVKRIEKQMD